MWTGSKVEVYFEGLLKSINSHKDLVGDVLRTIGRHFGWVFNILYSILYNKHQSIIHYDTNVTIIIFTYITCTITHHWLLIWWNSLPPMAINTLIQMPYVWLYNPIIKYTSIEYIIETLGTL